MENSKEDQPTYFVDERRIEAQQDRTIGAAAELLDQVNIINAALHSTSEILRLYSHSNEDELTALRLALRCFNSSAAALRLLRCGYYQPSFSMIRDLIETTFLLDLFAKKPSDLKLWRILSEKKRRQQFAPFKVRKKLDEMSDFEDSKRTQIYQMLSNYAAHPTPEGFQIISPNNMTKVGPFSDAKLLKAGLGDLSKHLALATLIIFEHVRSDDIDIRSVKKQFINTSSQWWDKYSYGSSN